MTTLMNSEGARPSEGQIAKLANERAHISVPAGMILQMSKSCEAGVTETALVRSLACMDACVRSQVAFFSEGLAAYIADKRTLACMIPPVHLQVARTAKDLLAVVARVEPAVDVKLKAYICARRL
jgi:hypothetical protein